LALIDPTHRFFPWFEVKIDELAVLSKVIDIGTSARFAKEVGFLRDRFDGNYEALGYHPDDFGDDTCDHDGDVLALTFDDGSYDGAICLEVMEHVLNPFQGLRELHRILKPGGLLLFSVPFLTSYHGHPPKEGEGFDPSHTGFPDFCWFTHQGLQLLFKDFSEVEIVPVEGPLGVRLNLFKFDRMRVSRWGFVQRLLAKLDKPKLGRATTRHFVFARK
jgi:SAM-dependent methyltransferase